MTWKFALPLLSRAEVFAKSKAVLTRSLGNSNYPCYHEINISQKYGRFYEVNWKFALPLVRRGKLFPKIKQFCWCNLKICTAPIIKSWSFAKSKAVLTKSLENLNYPCYHEVNFTLQKSSFVDVIWNFELPLLSQAEIFSKIW